jgi:hypothetical protein
MIIQCENLHVKLKRGSTFELTGACGNKLTCVTGTIWVTQHHRSNDWVLQSSEFLTIENPGKVVISACNESATFSAQQRVNERAKSCINQVQNPGNCFPSRTTRAEA